MKDKHRMSPAGLSFRQFGSPGGTTIVFLHGGGAGAWMWKPVIKRLPEFHCLAPDLPEHGESRHISPFSMELAVRFVAELIQAHAPGGQVVVVGLSEGAQVAVQMLASAPSLIEKAMISSALLKPLPGMGWMSSRTFLAWTYRLFVSPLRNQNWWIRLNMKYSAGIPDEFFDDFKKSFRGMSETGFINLMIANQRFRLPAGLQRANMPVLVLAGKREYAAMRQSAKALVAALPSAKGGMINLGKGSSLAQEHNWALYAPDIFARTVRAWVHGSALPKEIEDLNNRS
jgi:pimeloyl-ACP methyl ester carboxylesterase